MNDNYLEMDDTLKNRYLTFDLANQGYGIEIRYVTEIISLQKITELPDMPEYIKGVINLRGKVIPVIDVRCRFKLDLKEYDDNTRIIVVDHNSHSVGLVVDEVCEVVDIPEEMIEPSPSNQGAGDAYIAGMGKINDSVKILLSVHDLLKSDSEVIENTNSTDDKE